MCSSRVRTIATVLFAAIAQTACVDPMPKLEDARAPASKQQATAPRISRADPSDTSAEPLCEVVAVTEAAARLSALRARLEDAEKLANVTSRITLAGPVQSLQELHREIAATAVPSCMRRARFLLAQQAESTANGFLAFMEGATGEPTAVAHRMAARQYADRFSSALAEVAECAPQCPELLTWSESREEPLQPSAVAPTAPGASSTVATTGPLVRLRTASRITESNSSWARFAWQSTFRNDGSVPLRFSITIEFIDADGYTIDSDTAYGAELPPRSERTFTGDTLITMPAASRVASIRTKVSPS